MRVIVFANGIITEYDWLKALIRKDDYLVCADGGTYHCLACDCMPHVVVGDMDSLDAETLSRLQNQGVPFQRHSVAKNETDLELAIDIAVDTANSQRATAKPVDEILLVGVLGGRLDQMLANLLILAQQEWPVPLRIVDREESAQLLNAGEMITIRGSIGETLSAIPLSPTVTGITYTGLLYPLQNATLKMGSTRGISNEFADEEATISIDTGRLLIVHRHTNAQ